MVALDSVIVGAHTLVLPESNTPPPVTVTVDFAVLTEVMVIFIDDELAGKVETPR